MACHHDQDPGHTRKLVYLYWGWRSGALYTVQQRLAWGGGARKPLGQATASAAASALASALRSLRIVVWCRGQCGVVWYGVVWCAAIVLLRRIGRGPECMNLVQAAMLLYCVCFLGLHVAHPPPSVRLFVSGWSFVASRKSKSFKLVRSLVGCMG